MHPPEELLLSFVSGEADLPHRALIEAHLATCAVCRDAVSELAAPGARLLRHLPEAPPPPALWERLARRVQAEPQDAAAHSPLAAFPLAEAARRELPLAALQQTPDWSFAGTWGAHYCPLAADPATGSTLYLGRIGPDRRFPRHIHVGPEDILVLTGGYEDQRGLFEAGQYAVYEDGSSHSPRTEPHEECWLLWRLEHPVRFTGWRGVVQWFWPGGS
jgi:putative transcriptional regulator